MRTQEDSIEYNPFADFRHTDSQEPVSEELEEAAEEWDESLYRSDAFKAGAKWQKERLWKPADGDNLPEIDREVIVLIQTFTNDPDHLKVAFGHRPDPKGTDVKFLMSGKTEHICAETYDKGGWNQPDVKYWLDLDLPLKQKGEL